MIFVPHRNWTVLANDSSGGNEECSLQRATTRDRPVFRVLPNIQATRVQPPEGDHKGSPLLWTNGLLEPRPLARRAPPRHHLQRRCAFRQGTSCPLTPRCDDGGRSARVD